jgi:hypothetical protein
VGRSWIILCIAHIFSTQERPFAVGFTAIPVDFNRESILVGHLRQIDSRRVLLSGQKLVTMSVYEFVQCPLHGPGQVGRNNILTVAGEPFLHGVDNELLFGNSHKSALFPQPIVLGCADHHPKGATGLIRLLRNRFRVILWHGLDRSRASDWIHGARSPSRERKNPAVRPLCSLVSNFRQSSSPALTDSLSKRVELDSKLVWLGR